MNLIDDEYTSGKGFCADLDEGKFSFPLVHAWHSHPPDLILRGILQERKASGPLSIPHKKIILDRLHHAGSMDHTLRVLEKMKDHIYDGLEHSEEDLRCKSWVMRLLICRLLV